MQTPEAKIKKQVVDILKRVGAYYFYPVTGGYGRSGVPDIVACWNSRFIAIECKAGKNVPTALQEKNLREITENGGITFVVNENTLRDFAEMWAFSDFTDVVKEAKKAAREVKKPKARKASAGKTK